MSERNEELGHVQRHQDLLSITFLLLQIRSCFHIFLVLLVNQIQLNKERD